MLQAVISAAGPAVVALLSWAARRVAKELRRLREQQEARLSALEANGTVLATAVDELRRELGAHTSEETRQFTALREDQQRQITDVWKHLATSSPVTT